MSIQFHNEAEFAAFNLKYGQATYTVAALPTPPATAIGATVFATDGRKSGEGAGVGTGVPVYWSGAAWLTFYGNTAVAA